MTTYYEILEVSEFASVETIRAAYRSLSKRFHPDNKKTGNAEKFRLIGEAHECLTVEEKRKAYDRELGKSRKYKGTGGVDDTGDAVKKPRAKRAATAQAAAEPAYDPRQGVEALFAIGDIALRTYGNPVVAQVVRVLRPDLEKLAVEAVRGALR